MNLTTLAALAATTALAISLAVRERLRLRRARRTHAEMQAVAPQAALPLSSSAANRRQPDGFASADAWMLAAVDGSCAVISEEAQRILGVTGTAGPEGDWRLQTLLHDGDREAAAILADLTTQSLAPTRRIRAVARPTDPIDLTGVALRDRCGNLWGGALFLRSLRDQSKLEAVTDTHPFTVDLSP